MRKHTEWLGNLPKVTQPENDRIEYKPRHTVPEPTFIQKSKLSLSNIYNKFPENKKPPFLEQKFSHFSKRKNHLRCLLKMQLGYSDLVGLRAT